MPTVECLIVHNGQLLMMRRPASELQAEGLLPVGCNVEAGESPIEACGREVQKVAGLTVTPSCVAITFNDKAEVSTDYCLTFVASLDAAEKQATRTDGVEWVTVAELPGRDDVPEPDRSLIPRVLESGRPMAIVLDVDKTTSPWTRRLMTISTIDPARLSPLVFAKAGRRSVAPNPAQPG